MTISHLVTRRSLLRGAAALATSVALAGGRTQQAAAFADQTAWSTLGQQFGNRLLRPGDPGYTAIATPWNLRHPGPLAAGIVRCKSHEDVRWAIAWARDTGTPLVARSGGHSYGGFSTTTGLIIDVSLMNNVHFDALTGTAQLGGGARNSDVYSALRPYSTSVTHGRCYGVGVAGLVLGGGVGFNMRFAGLTCDQLLQTEIVTANGDILTCSERENSDLFWAARGGGGGNFGIHTAFTFQTFPVSEVTVFDITWNTRLEALLPAIQQALIASPITVGAKLSVSSVPGDQGRVVELHLLGQVQGGSEGLATLLDVLQPGYRIAQPSVATIKTVPYWDGQTFLSEAGDPEYSHERSRYAYGPISATGLDTILQSLHAFPGSAGVGTWKCFLTGGAVDRLSRTATAYVHRGASMISSVELNWHDHDPSSEVQRMSDWLAEFHENLRPFTSSEAYQNFIDDAETDWATAYYCENLPQLQSIKRAYDPDAVFSFAQSIPLR